ncbi:MAG: hypothetical protein JSS22_17995 [Proteobacteria bacterium]|nr:hypothetical protein [Pseudomonadota bacterium]
MAAVSFGMVLRSSAIFYYRKTADFRSTISFVNYWRAKRSLNVAIVASVREMDGKLLIREQLPLTTFGVVNYQPRIDRSEFEGSVEIEVFCNENMVIPYAAIMGVYETANSISTVHSYARAYSRFEVEEGRTISSGREGCWSLRDTDDVDSFCVFHNGPRSVAAQSPTLRIRNSEGNIHEVCFDLGPLSPYQSVKLRPKDHFGGLAAFLNGQLGDASINLTLGEGFTRMLVGNERCGGTDFQVTHSNFDYSDHRTDHLDERQGAFMCAPSCGITDKRVVIYPDASQGRYMMSCGNDIVSFASGELVTRKTGSAQETFEFRRDDGPFPSRLVTGLIVPNDGDLIDNECSLGVITPLQPKKRFWWGVCSADDKRASKLIVHDLPDVFGGILNNSTIELSLYSSTGNKPLKRVLDKSDLGVLDKGVDFADLFSEAPSFLNGDFGYFTMFSDYGGLSAYTLFNNRRGSHALEHGF